MRWVSVVVAIALAGTVLWVNRPAGKDVPEKSVEKSLPGVMPAEAKAPVAGDTVSKGVSVIDLKKSLASEPKRNVTIRAEMTLSEVADQAGVKAEDLAAKLGIPAEGAGTQRLSDLGALYGFDLEKVRKVVMEQAGDCIETCKVE